MLCVLYVIAVLVHMVFAYVSSKYDVYFLDHYFPNEVTTLLFFAIRVIVYVLL
jgi:hypothetical protein